MKNAFTVGELLLVVVVILFLGGITFRQFSLAFGKTRDVQRKSDLHEISKAIRMYYADYGNLPDESLVNSLWGKRWLDGDYVYMEQVPKENYLSVPYCYMRDESGKSFILFTELEYKQDPDCKMEKQKCGENYYCYVDKLPAEVKTDD